MGRIVVPVTADPARQLYMPRREDPSYANEKTRQTQRWADAMSMTSMYDAPLATTHTFTNTSYLTAPAWGISLTSDGVPLLQLRTVAPCSIHAVVNLSFIGPRLVYRLDYAMNNTYVGPVVARNIYTPTPAGGAQLTDTASFCMDLKANATYDFDVNVLCTGSTDIVGADTYATFVVS